MSQKQHLEHYLRDVIDRSNNVFRGESNEKIATKIMIYNLFHKDEEWKTILRQHCVDPAIERQIRYLGTLPVLPEDDRAAWWGLLSLKIARGKIHPESKLFVHSHADYAPRKTRYPLEQASFFQSQIEAMSKCGVGCSVLPSLAVPLFIGTVSLRRSLCQMMRSQAFLADTNVSSSIASDHLYPYASLLMEHLSTHPDERRAAIAEAMELLELSSYNERVAGLSLVKPISEKVEKSAVIEEIRVCYGRIGQLYVNADVDKMDTESLNIVSSRIASDSVGGVQLESRKKNWLEDELITVRNTISALSANQLDAADRIEKMRQIVKSTISRWAELGNSVNQNAVYKAGHGDALNAPPVNVSAIDSEEELRRVKANFQSRINILLGYPMLAVNSC